MPIQDITTPTLFGGGYVQRLSADLGLNSSPSSVDVQFVIDTDGQGGIQQAFNEDDMIPGSITGISCGSLSFNGVVQSWRENFSVGGKTYSARLVDPRIIFGDVQLNLNGRGARLASPENVANGSGIYNYINVYDIYGNDYAADYNDNGMTFNKIRDGLAGSGFVYVYDKKFQLTFDDGFTAPAYMRINSEEMSLDQLLADVSEKLGIDYYVTLDSYDAAAEYNTLNIRSINRIQSENGENSIATYLGEKRVEGTLREYSRGKELRSGPTDTVVLGANKNFIQTITDSYPCYGRTAEGILLSAAGNTQDFGPSFEPLDDENRHSGFVLLDNIVSSNSTLINAIPSLNVNGRTQQLITDTYPPTLLQTDTDSEIKGYRPTENVMRAALFSRESWEAIIFLEQEDIARQFGIRGLFIKDVNDALELVRDKRQNTFSFESVNSDILDRTFEEEALIQIVYEKTRDVAENFYGRQFLLKLPFSGFDLATGSTPSNGLKYRFGWKVVESAWYDNAGQTLTLSGNRNFRDDQGKILSHVTIQNARDNQVPGVVITNPNSRWIGTNSIVKFDLSNLSEEEYLEDNTDIHVAIRVTQDSTNLSRAIAILDKPILFQEIQGVDVDEDYKIPASYIQFCRLIGFTDEEIVEFMFDFYPDNQQFGLAAQRVTHFDYFQVAIENEFVQYGPFIANGDRHGGVKIIRDDSLAPWTYNSYAYMNYAGQDVANLSTADRTTVESATFTLAGLPEKNLGDALGDNANVTSLNMTYGTELTTSYGLQTTVAPFTRLSKILNAKIYSNAIVNRKVQKDVVRLEDKIKEMAIGQVGVFNIVGSAKDLNIQNMQDRLRDSNAEPHGGKIFATKER